MTVGTAARTAGPAASSGWRLTSDGYGWGMSITRMPIPATPDDVFAVLADGRSYERWLVGCKRIRAVDSGWPAQGTRIHHRFGWGPVTTDDTTAVVQVERPRRLVLEARARPVGVAQVTFQIDDDPDRDGCVVVVEEHPVRGLAAKIHNPVMDAMVALRNRKSLRALSRLAVSEAGRGQRATAESD